MQLNVINLISDLFPKENYKEKKVPSDEILHYLIALRQPAETITAWIQKKDLKSLAHRSINQLSALDLCAIFGREDIAKELLKKKVSPSAPDRIGRTPLHYASLIHGESAPIFACLKSALKSHEVVSEILRGNDKDFLNLDKVLAQTLPAPTDPVFYYRKEDQIVQGSAKEFKEMTGAAYTDRILVTKEGLLKEWFSSPLEHSEEIQEYLRVAYRQFKKEAGKVYLDKNPQINQLGVYARRDIKIGEIILVYTGEQVGAALPDSTNPYHMHSTDALNVRNEAAMVNHGFPNAMAFGLHGNDGMQTTALLIACEPIKQGDQICYNYGHRHTIVRSNQRIELRSVQFFQYFATHPITHFQDRLREVDQKSITLSQHILPEGKWQKLKYLVEDPHAFAALLEAHRGDKAYLTKLVKLLEDTQFQTAVNLNPVTAKCFTLLCDDMIETGKINEFTFEQLLQISQLL